MCVRSCGTVRALTIDNVCLRSEALSISPRTISYLITSLGRLCVYATSMKAPITSVTFGLLAPSLEGSWKTSVWTGEKERKEQNTDRKALVGGLSLDCLH